MERIVITKVIKFKQEIINIWATKTVSGVRSKPSEKERTNAQSTTRLKNFMKNETC